jgi:hypothetical protein
MKYLVVKRAHEKGAGFYLEHIKTFPDVFEAKAYLDELQASKETEPLAEGTYYVLVASEERIIE